VVAGADLVAALVDDGSRAARGEGEGGASPRDRAPATGISIMV